MTPFVIGALALVAIVYLINRALMRDSKQLAGVPEKFIVLDLETTGLEPVVHEIIEIGAILVNRDSDRHQTLQALVRPSKKIPKKIVSMTGITQEMIDKEGEELADVIPQFLDFFGELPLVAFNANFDMAFLNRAVSAVAPNRNLDNEVICALKLARRAWSGRSSYRLVDLAKDGGLDLSNRHRALDDCQRAMIVYTAATSRLSRKN